VPGARSKQVNIRHFKKGLLSANVVLTGLIVWMAAIVILGLHSGQVADGSIHSQTAIEIGTNQPAIPKATQPAAYQGIVRRDIFDTTRAGVAPPVQVPQPENKEIPPTQLNLILKGTVVGDQESYAVITDGRTNREEIYVLNDAVQDAQVTEILTDRVILSLGGKKESLILFPEKTAEKDRVSNPARTVPPARRPVVRRPPVARQAGVNSLPRR